MYYVWVCCHCYRRPFRDVGVGQKVGGGILEVEWTEKWVQILEVDQKIGEQVFRPNRKVGIRFQNCQKKVIWF